MNILIVNQPLNNRGDESAHKALTRALLQKIPDAKISVLWSMQIRIVLTSSRLKTKESHT